MKTLKVIPRPLRAHLFLTAFVVFALIGGGLRFIPTSAAALAGSSPGQSGAASTACSAS